MELTNKYNLPGPIINAIKGFDHAYQKGRGDAKISVTQLINPPLIKFLKEEHYDEIVEDASGRIWSIIGSAIHSILEHAGSANDLTEERLAVTIDDVKISGQGDLYEADGTLSDYKVTSVWSVKGYAKPEWISQLNVLAYLYEEAGFKVSKLQIVAILRDWSKGMSKRGGDYPKCNVKVIPIERWSRDRALEYIKERIAIHTSDDVPECTSAEKWEKPTVYAVMKAGRKSAIKLYETREEAEKDDRGTYIETRPGSCLRCEDYCSVNKWCPYYENKEEE